MSTSRIQQAFPGIDKLTEWYLSETIYCLQQYLGFSEGQAFELLTSWSNLKALLADDPKLLHSESAFYWAMGLVKGFDSQWWKDAELWDQHNEYLRTRHHPLPD